MNKVASDQEVKSSGVIDRPYICYLKPKIVTEGNDSEDDPPIDGIKKKTYKCSTCKIQFPSHSTWMKHIKEIHKRGKPCEVCGKEFVHKNQLDIHMCIHTGERRFTCEKCFKMFYTRRNLTEHVRNAHEDERKFECTVCLKLFKRKQALTFHLRTHTGEKPYSCELCDKSFTDSTRLRYHVNYSHENENKVFECDKCDKVFTEKYRLDYHVRAHHQELCKS